LSIAGEGMRIARVVRGGEWWEHKLVPIFFGFYAGSYLLGRSISSQWESAILLLLALVPGAAYVSVVNDLTDLRDDAAAGKANRMAGRSAAFRTAALLATLAGGGIFFWLWREDPLRLALYGAAWVAFTLYSVPPIRLKTKGLAGVAADAAGAHLFPTLLAATLPFTAGEMPSPPWLAAVAAWSFAYGLRSNLWHQIFDRDHDRAAGAGTFGARHSRDAVARFGAWLVFPAELAALAVLLWLIGSALPLVALAAYLLLVRRRVKTWQLRAVIVAPRGNYLILLHEYYNLFLPLAVLIASALAHPLDWLAVAVHLLVFRHGPGVAWHDGWRLIFRPLLQSARALLRPARR